MRLPHFEHVTQRGNGGLADIKPAWSQAAHSILINMSVPLRRSARFVKAYRSG
jgi:hypothetical protein